MIVLYHKTRICQDAFRINAQRIKISTLSRAQYSQLKTAYRGNYASSVDAISISDLYELVKTIALRDLGETKSDRGRQDARSSIEAADNLHRSVNYSIS